jgi:hypothetical protein
MRVNAFGLALGWKWCAKMRLSGFTYMILRARNWKPRESKWMSGESPCRFTSCAFDMWMGRTFPRRRGHCGAMADRSAACKLVMHPEKTKIVYCRHRRQRYRHALITGFET